MASLCAASAECLQLCAEKGYLGSLLRELDGTDILGKLNALELLARVACEAPFAADYLHTIDVIPKLHRLLQVVSDAPDGTFLFPGSQLPALLFRFWLHSCSSPLLDDFSGDSILRLYGQNLSKRMLRELPDILEVGVFSGEELRPDGRCPAIACVRYVGADRLDARRKANSRHSQ